MFSVESYISYLESYTIQNYRFETGAIMVINIPEK